ncbi:MAG: glycine cleavage system aminomethyltransferase GcvT, partial [Acidimicrobiia bacterium]|nr:glycine cleavage system aminomethyltransferase GcvT [Acidimicrobiia bacterium]
MTNFGGWEMPLSYPTGTVAEHLTCRNDAALFDVSHLGTVRVAGPAAFDTLQHALTNDLRKIAPGRAQYTHSCNERGGVVDDIIVWWVSDDVFDVMPNASNTDTVRAAIGGDDVTHTRAVLAVQGPHSRMKLSRVSADAAAVKRFRVEHVEVLGVPCVVAGTGYTGEDGVEIAVPAEHAVRIASALHDAGIALAGLGARDTLRTEMGYPLHGHELSLEISPLDANLSWAVGWKKATFKGHQALRAKQAKGVDRILRGLLVTDRGIPRAGMLVRNSAGAAIGEVTSGTFSPTLKQGIALALIEAGIEV